jgi:DNA-binding response OmpR family regulator
MSVRVLVVEDEFMIALDISQQLAAAGFEVVGPAKSVAKALGLVAEPGCDVAILDLNLGGETSESVARKLRALGKPFIILSGYSTDDPLQWLNGATVLRKPLPMCDLLAAIRACVDMDCGTCEEFQCM